MDRHAKNYFVKVEDGKFVGVTGIDNDLSFGKAKDRRDRELRPVNAFAQHGRFVADKNENLFIPHMSRKLAMNIVLIDESVARYTLSDLIGKADIDAFCERLAIVKRAVKKELEKDPKDSRLVGDDEWDDQLQDFLSAENDLIGDVANGKSNYIGELVENWSVDNYYEQKNIFLKLKKEKGK